MPIDIMPRNEKGQRHGYWESYYFSGNIMRRGEYRNDLHEGHWEYYNDNGSRMYFGTYQNGREIGFWTSYLSDSSVLKRIFYAN